MTPEAAPGLTLRDAVPEDLPALVALARKTFSDKFAHLYNPEDLAAFLEESHSADIYRGYLSDPENLIRVAEDADGTLKAYLMCSPLALPAKDPLPGAVELKRVYVDASLQGQGIGSGFIEEALAWEKVREFIFPVGRHRDLEYLLRLKL